MPLNLSFTDLINNILILTVLVQIEQPKQDNTFDLQDNYHNLKQNQKTNFSA